MKKNHILTVALVYTLISQGFAGPPETIKIVSNNTWKAYHAEVAGWETIGFDDSVWYNAAAPVRRYAHEYYPHPPHHFIPGTSAKHMWNNHFSAWAVTAYFRKSFYIDGSPCVSEAIIRPDDGYQFYVNGVLLSSGFQVQPQTVDLTPYLMPGENIFAIKAWNNGVSIHGWRSILFDATVSVVEDTPPTITCPADLILECPADISPDATGTATATDECDKVPTVTYNDTIVSGCGNTMTITRTWTAADDSGHVSSCDQVITIVDTTPPDIADLTADTLLLAKGETVNFSATINDLCDETVDAEWDFGDGTSSAIPSHVYTQAGIYTATVTATDDCGNTSADALTVVVYDPRAGFTLGGGRFIPDGESVMDGSPITDTISPVKFAFIAKYKWYRETRLIGHLILIYKSANIILCSKELEWLVHEDSQTAVFKGYATINGAGEYTYRATVRDSGRRGKDNDQIEILIWDGKVEDSENDPPPPLHELKGTLYRGNILVHMIKRPSWNSF